MIRIAQPVLGPDEEAAVLDVLRSGQLVQGPRVAQFEEVFARAIGVQHAVAVSSGTAALQLALQAHGVGQGDEVLVPAFTFAATANAVLLAGAKPALVDITLVDFNIDQARIEEALTPRTKAIIVAHLFGHPANMTAIAGIAARHGLALVEDAAQALGAAWQGRKCGSFGTGCFSFYATKGITTGEGGMITTNDEGIAGHARLLRNQGERERYRTEVLAANFRMTEIAAALGLAQLPKLDAWNDRRRANAAWLSERLRGVVTPAEAAGAHHVYHQYTVRVPAGRDALQAHLRDRDIEAVVYYPRAVHQQPLYQELGIGGSFPAAERAAEEVLSLPVHPALTNDDLERIASAVNEAVPSAPAEARRG